MSKGKFEPFQAELVRLRGEGYTYEQLAIWLADNKKVVASVTGVRNFLKQLEIKERATK
ncbi:hypothetical protein PSW42_11505 [Yersinia pestis]|nr:hypothetical protein [Yersinia pestis]